MTVSKHFKLSNKKLHKLRNTERGVENTTRGRVFLTNFEAFEMLSNPVLSVWYIFSIEAKPKEKTEK